MYPPVWLLINNILKKIQFAIRLRISCRIFLSSLTLNNTSSFLTWSIQLIFSILLQHHISKLSRCFWSTAVSRNSRVLKRNRTVMPDTLECRRCLIAQEFIVSRKPSLFKSVLTGTQNPGITWKKSRLSAQYSVSDRNCRLVFESLVSWLKTKSRWLKTNCRVINFRDMLPQGYPYISKHTVVTGNVQRQI